jgi:hypothetical protein
VDERGDVLAVDTDRVAGGCRAEKGTFRFSAPGREKRNVPFRR